MSDQRADAPTISPIGSADFTSNGGGDDDGSRTLYTYEATDGNLSSVGSSPSLLLNRVLSRVIQGCDDGFTEAVGIIPGVECTDGNAGSVCDTFDLGRVDDVADVVVKNVGKFVSRDAARKLALYKDGEDDDDDDEEEDEEEKTLEEEEGSESTIGDGDGDGDADGSMMNGRVMSDVTGSTSAFGDGKSFHVEDALKTDGGARAVPSEDEEDDEERTFETSSRTRTFETNQDGTTWNDRTYETRETRDEENETEATSYYGEGGEGNTIEFASTFDTMQSGMSMFSSLDQKQQGEGGQKIIDTADLINLENGSSAADPSVVREQEEQPATATDVEPSTVVESTDIDTSQDDPTWDPPSRVLDIEKKRKALAEKKKKKKKMFFFGKKAMDPIEEEKEAGEEVELGKEPKMEVKQEEEPVDIVKEEEVEETISPSQEGSAELEAEASVQGKTIQAVVDDSKSIEKGGESEVELIVDEDSRTMPSQDGSAELEAEASVQGKVIQAVVDDSELPEKGGESEVELIVDEDSKTMPSQDGSAELDAEMEKTIQAVADVSKLLEKEGESEMELIVDEDSKAMPSQDGNAESVAEELAKTVPPVVDDSESLEKEKEDADLDEELKVTPSQRSCNSEADASKKTAPPAGDVSELPENKEEEKEDLGKDLKVTSSQGSVELEAEKSEETPPPVVDETKILKEERVGEEAALDRHLKWAENGADANEAEEVMLSPQSNINSDAPADVLNNVIMARELSVATEQTKNTVRTVSPPPGETEPGVMEEEAGEEVELGKEPVVLEDESVDDESDKILSTEKSVESEANEQGKLVGNSLGMERDCSDATDPVKNTANSAVLPGEFMPPHGSFESETEASEIVNNIILGRELSNGTGQTSALNLSIPPGDESGPEEEGEEVEFGKELDVVGELEVEAAEAPVSYTDNATLVDVLEDTESVVDDQKMAPDELTQDTREHEVDANNDMPCKTRAPLIHLSMDGAEMQDEVEMENVEERAETKEENEEGVPSEKDCLDSDLFPCCGLGGAGGSGDMTHDDSYCNFFAEESEEVALIVSDIKQWVEEYTPVASANTNTGAVMAAEVQSATEHEEKPPVASVTTNTGAQIAADIESTSEYENAPLDVAKTRTRSQMTAEAESTTENGCEEEEGEEIDLDQCLEILHELELEEREAKRQLELEEMEAKHQMEVEKMEAEQRELKAKRIGRLAELLDTVYGGNISQTKGEARASKILEQYEGKEDILLDVLEEKAASKKQEVAATNEEKAAAKTLDVAEVKEEGAMTKTTTTNKKKKKKGLFHAFDQKGKKQEATAKEEKQTRKKKGLFKVLKKKTAKSSNKEELGMESTASPPKAEELNTEDGIQDATVETVPEDHSDASTNKESKNGSSKKDKATVDKESNADPLKEDVLVTEDGDLDATFDTVPEDHSDASTSNDDKNGTSGKDKASLDKESIVTPLKDDVSNAEGGEGDILDTTFETVPEEHSEIITSKEAKNSFSEEDNATSDKESIAGPLNEDVSITKDGILDATFEAVPDDQSDVSTNHDVKKELSEKNSAPLESGEAITQATEALGGKEPESEPLKKTPSKIKRFSSRFSLRSRKMNMYKEIEGKQ